MPAATTRSFTTRDTASPDNRAKATRLWPSTGRKTGPASIPAAASQRSRARTGQWQVRPKGMPTLRSALSWSVFERLSVTTSPCRTRRRRRNLAPDFRSSEPAGKADQEQRSVARALQGVAHRVHDLEQVISQQRLGLPLRDTARALDAPQCGADDFEPAGVGTPRLMRLRDRRDAANERGERRASPRARRCRKRQALARQAGSPPQAAKWARSDR